MRFLFLFAFLFLGNSIWAQIQDNAIIASIEKTGEGTFDVVFTFQRAVTGVGNPINVYLKVPDAEAFSSPPTVSSSYGLAFISPVTPFAGSTYYIYQGQPSIGLSSFDAGDRLIAGSFTVPEGSTTNQVGLSGGGDFPQDNFNTGSGFIWAGTSLLSDNTERNLVAWPIASVVFLPVTLLTFEARPASKTVQLDWVTAQEIDNRGFHVQHSANGQRFTTIGFVEGMNYGSVYDFVHVSPVTGTNYYRLEQEDFDGTREFSDIRAVDFNGLAGNISLWPNPTSDYINFTGGNLEKPFSINLVDGNGRVVLKGYGGAPLDVRRLPAGVYRAVVLIGETSISSHKLIIYR